MVTPHTVTGFPLDLNNEIPLIFPDYVGKYALTVSDVTTMF